MPENSKNRSRGEGSSGYQVARRSIWYLLRTAVIVVLVVTVMIGITITGIYIGNIYIVATEGMALRADFILRGGSIYELEEYFSREWLMNDSLINAGLYEGYSITAYDYQLDVEGINALPWSQTGTISFLERVPTITGTADNNQINPEIPKWTDVRCTLTLELIEGRWYITAIDVTEENPEYVIANTPDMNMTPVILPTATPNIVIPSPSSTDSMLMTLDPMTTNAPETQVPDEP